MRVALLVERNICAADHRHHAFVAALRRELPQSTLLTTRDDHAEVLGRLAARRGDFDLVLTFVYFRKLRQVAAALRATGLPAVMVELDAYANHVAASPRRGELDAFLAEARIDLLVVTGQRHCERLRAAGQRCLYLPKAAPAAFLARADPAGDGFCAFGSLRDPVYAQRAALFAALAPEHGGPAVDRLRFDFARMPEALARYAGCVICDRGLEEPMAKHFEVAALGRAPIRDDEAEAELIALGYRDGESMVVYRSLDDLLAKLDHYRRHPAALRAIQAGARAASRPHSWEARARSLRQALVGVLRG